MSLYELTEDEIVELKLQYLIDNLSNYGLQASYVDALTINNIVPFNCLVDKYHNRNFEKSDFACNVIM